MILNGLGLEARPSASWARRQEREGVRRQRRGHSVAARRDLDPHAWQSIANAKIYVANIRDALIAVDPADKSIFEANAAAYLSRLDALDAEVTAEIAKIPPDRRELITTHDAFGYFGTAYGIAFIAPHGVSTEAEGSARDIAHIIKQIRARAHSGGVPGERDRSAAHGTDRARIRRARGRNPVLRCAHGADGPAPTYIDLMRHNVKQLVAALR